MKLYLNNFQVHRNLEMEFDPGITVITGPTDVGKSSVVRALRWIALNRPFGAQIVKHGKKKARIRLEVDGHSISRIRGTEKNHYFLDRKKFSAFGTEVPEEIRKLLNIDQENFQGQHDSPYWFSLPAGEVSRQLNKIINLDLIDRVLNDVATQLRQAKGRVDLVQERLSVAEKRRSELSWIVDAKTEFAGIVKLEEELEGKSLAASKLKEIMEEGKRLVLLVERGNKLKSFVEEAYDIGSNLIERDGKINSLKNLLAKITEMKRELYMARKGVREASDILSQQKNCPICGNLL